MKNLKRLFFFFTIFVTLLDASPIFANESTNSCGSGSEVSFDLLDSTITDGVDVNCEAIVQLNIGPTVVVESGGTLSAASHAIAINGPFQVQSGASFVARTSIRKPQIQFKGDQSVILSSAGDEATFEALLLDRYGKELPNAALAWRLDASNSVVLASTNDRSATVRASSHVPDGVDLVATYAPLGIEAKARVLVAELVPNTHLISSDLVVSRQVTTNTETIEIQKTQITEGYQVGDYILSGDGAGILIRITNIQLKTSSLVIAGSSSSMTEVFNNLRTGQVESAAKSYRVQYEVDSKKMTITDKDTGETINQQAKSLADILTCRVGSEKAIGLELTEGSILFDTDIKSRASLDIDPNGVAEFSIGVRGEASAVAVSPGFNFSSNVAGEIDCQLVLPGIESPSIPFGYIFSANLGIYPHVGLRVTASFNGPSLSFSGPNAQLGASYDFAICYGRTAGWSNCSNSNVTSSYEIVGTSFEPTATFGATAAPYTDLNFGLGISLGKGSLSYDLVNVLFADLKKSLFLSLELTSPIDPLDPMYTGPSWTLEDISSSSLKAEIAQGTLTELLRKIGFDETNVSVNLPIIPESSEQLAKSPTPEISVECNPECPIMVNQSPENYVVLSTALDTMDSGANDYLIAKDDESELDVLSTTQLIDGAASYQWSPTEDDVGEYVAYPRIRIDALSELFPYANSLGTSFNVLPPGEYCEKHSLQINCYIRIDNGNIVQTRHYKFGGAFFTKLAFASEFRVIEEESRSFSQYEVTYCGSGCDYSGAKAFQELEDNHPDGTYPKYFYNWDPSESDNNRSHVTYENGIRKSARYCYRCGSWPCESGSTSTWKFRQATYDQNGDEVESTEIYTDNCPIPATPGPTANLVRPPPNPDDVPERD